jgi:hypothetical protein
MIDAKDVQVLYEFGLFVCDDGKDACDHYDCTGERKMASEIVRLRASVATLTRERDAARVVTDAMVERAARVILSRHVIATGKNAEKAWLWYGDDFKHEARELLTAALSEAP